MVHRHREEGILLLWNHHRNFIVVDLEVAVVVVTAVTDGVETDIMMDIVVAEEIEEVVLVQVVGNATEVGAVDTTEVTIIEEEDDRISAIATVEVVVTGVEGANEKAFAVLLAPTMQIKLTLSCKLSQKDANDKMELTGSIN